MSVPKTDTIAAIATPPGRSALAVIRVSGPQAFSIVDKILTNKRPAASHSGFTLYKSAVTDSSDTAHDVLVAVFHAPHSYTGDDTVEISCHGGAVAVRQTLNALLANGARLADPGEFTIRAFLNGKLDLAQAEAVIDIIDAQTDTALRHASKLQRGDLSKTLEPIRDSLITILTRVEATIDFPEDVGDFPTDWASEQIETTLADLRKLADSARRGVLYREGISVVLAGAPNAGKSSLLNALLRSDRAIVTAIPGTTRDVIEESIDIAGIPVRLSDTAGLRESEDIVERIGVERTKSALEAADIVVEVRDSTSSTHTEIDSSIVPRIVAWNKSDIAPNFSVKDGEILLSAKTGDGIDRLEERIAEIAFGASVDSGDRVVITHARHKRALDGGIEALIRAQSVMKNNEPLDFLSIEITSALHSIGEITGQTAPEEIVNEIFHRFCIGK